MITKETIEDFVARINRYIYPFEIEGDAEDLVNRTTPRALFYIKPIINTFLEGMCSPNWTKKLEPLLNKTAKKVFGKKISKVNPNNTGGIFWFYWEK